MTTYFLPAPRTPTDIENKIAHHIFKNLRGDKEWVEPRVYSGLGSRVEFYDKVEWVRHQGRLLQDVAGLVTEPGDHIFLADAWFPGVDAIALLHPAVHLVGFLHGHSRLPGDLMGKVSWAPDLEDVWWGQMFSRLLIQTSYTLTGFDDTNAPPYTVVGSPFDPEPLRRVREEGHDRYLDVVWPHRCASDKGFEDFLQVASYLKGLKVGVTTPDRKRLKDVEEKLARCGVEIWEGKSEYDYHRTLARSKVVLSTAYQENWGYAVMEAVAAGCIPVLPDRACYPCLYGDEWLYPERASAEDICQHIVRALRDRPAPPAMLRCDIEGKFENGNFLTDLD